MRQRVLHIRLRWKRCRLLVPNMRATFRVGRQKAFETSARSAPGGQADRPGKSSGVGGCGQAARYSREAEGCGRFRRAPPGTGLSRPGTRPAHAECTEIGPATGRPPGDWPDAWRLVRLAKRPTDGRPPRPTGCRRRGRSRPGHSGPAICRVSLARACQPIA